MSNHFVIVPKKEKASAHFVKADEGHFVKGMNDRNASASRNRGANIRRGVSITSGGGGGTKWITTSGGKRIPIDGNSGGGDKGGQEDSQGGSQTAEAQPQQKPESSLTPEQRQAADELRDAEPQAQTGEQDSQSKESNAGEGLNHAQMQTIATKIADRMGIDPSTVEVAEQDETDEVGAKAGEYDPSSGKITVYPTAFRSREELMGTLSHEAMHGKLDSVLKQFNEQQKAFQGGESLTSGNLETFKQLKPVFSSERASYAAADGVNKYSTMFWNSYKENPTTSRYTAAISETLSEVARLTQAGKGEGIHPQMKSLYNRVNSLAKGG